MDDAGGGMRGRRAAATQELLAAVQAAYGISFKIEPVDLGGSSTLNLLVADAQDRWVVRVYRPYVTPERLRDVHAARHALAAVNIPCDGLLPTVTREEWICFRGRLVEIEQFVEHDGSMDSWETVTAGMPVLAAIHDRLRGVGSSPAGRRPLFANHVASTEALAATLAGVERIRGWNPSAKELELACDAERLARLVARAEEPLTHGLGRQLVHGDFWDNNVFFRGGKIVFVSDFDFMGERPRIDDVALTLFCACMQYFEGSGSDRQIQRVRTLVDVYSAASEVPLTEAERVALPAAMARQPLWSIGGWVRLLDDERAARRHASESREEVRWALSLMECLQRWQGGLA